MASPVATPIPRPGQLNRSFHYFGLSVCRATLDDMRVTEDDVAHIPAEPARSARNARIPASELTVNYQQPG